MRKKAEAPLGVQAWIWKSFVKASLLLIIVFQLVFFAFNTFANVYATNLMLNDMTSQVNREATRIAAMESSDMNRQLNSITSAVKLYAAQAHAALLGTAQLSPQDQARLAYSADGTYHTTGDSPIGGAAVFYSGVSSVDEAGREKVARLLTLQPFMNDLKKSNPLISQVYFNSYDSLNVIYPYFNVIGHYSPHMDFTSFNFYYEADRQHNPLRIAQWTEVYLDPAGSGWMASCIEPVYNGDFLEGVAGIDIALNTIARQMLNVNIPWNGYAVLLGKDGTILALPPQGEEDWGLKELKSQRNSQNVKQDTFKPEQFNLYKMQNLSGFAGQVSAKDNGSSALTLNGQSKVVFWDTVEGTGWKLLLIMPQNSVYSDVNQIRSTLTTIGMIVVSCLVVFILLLFYILYRSSRRTSQNISQPLLAISRMARAIGAGDYYPVTPEFDVEEFRETSRNLAEAGEKLGKYNRELVQTQKKLQESEAYLRSVLGSIEDELVVIDENGFLETVLANNPELGASGYLPKTIESLHSIMSKNYADLILSKIKKVKETGKPEAVEYPLETPGGVRWLQARISPLQKSNKFIVSSRDINERKEMEQSILVARDEAQKASLAKSQFLSNMSHELQTPLNAVLGFAQVLKMDPSAPLNEMQEDSVNEIEKAGGHLLELINEVLDLAKIETGRLRVLMEPILVSEIMEETLALIRPMAEKYTITLLSPEARCCGMHVLADRIRIKQVLINLLSNAIKYNKPGGKVEYFCEQAGGRMRFHVTDTGPGIPEDEIGRIFEPFYRLQATSTAVEGTGIGLAVVRELMELMDGLTFVKSEEGKGSDFYIELAIAECGDTDGDLVKASADRLAFPAGSTGRTILYVEDNASNLMLVERIIKSLPNTKLISAVSAELGIDLARAHHPDLILLDINLPGMDGYEMLGRLQNSRETARIPVVAVSANAMEKDIAYALSMGFRDYITKPIRVTDFLEKLKKIL